MKETDHDTESRSIVGVRTGLHTLTIFINIFPSCALLRFIHISILHNNLFLRSLICSVFLYAVQMTVEPCEERQSDL